MDETFDQDLLLGYVEGDLEPEDLARFEERMTTDPALTRLVEGLRADRDALRRSPAEDPPGGMVDRAIQVEERRALIGDPDTRPPTAASAAPRPFALSRAITYVSVAAAAAIVGGIAVFMVGLPGDPEQGTHLADARTEHERIGRSDDTLDAALAESFDAHQRTQMAAGADPAPAVETDAPLASARAVAGREALGKGGPAGNASTGGMLVRSAPAAGAPPETVSAGGEPADAAPARSARAKGMSAGSAPVSDARIERALARRRLDGSAVTQGKSMGRRSGRVAVADESERKIASTDQSAGIAPAGRVAASTEAELAAAPAATDLAAAPATTDLAAAPATTDLAAAPATMGPPAAPPAMAASNRALTVGSRATTPTPASRVDAPVQTVQLKIKTANADDAVRDVYRWADSNRALVAPTATANKLENTPAGAGRSGNDLTVVINESQVPGLLDSLNSRPGQTVAFVVAGEGRSNETAPAVTGAREGLAAVRGDADAARRSELLFSKSGPAPRARLGAEDPDSARQEIVGGREFYSGTQPRAESQDSKELAETTADEEVAVETLAQTAPGWWQFNQEQQVQRRAWRGFDYEAVLETQLPLAEARPLDLLRQADPTVRVRVLIDEAADAAQTPSESSER